MRKIMLAVSLLLLSTTAMSGVASAAPSNPRDGYLRWSSTYSHVNPPQSWLSVSWKKMNLFVPADSIVATSSKTLEVQIPTSQEPLLVRFRMRATPAKVSVSALGALQVTHGSVSRMDALREFDPFGANADSAMEKQTGRSIITGSPPSSRISGLGAWRNRPAYSGYWANDHYMYKVLITAVRHSKKAQLLGVVAGGTPMAFAERGNDAWLVAHTLSFNDGISPQCRYPDGLRCIGAAKPPAAFPSSIRSKLDLPKSPLLKVNTAKSSAPRPKAQTIPFEQQIVVGGWNVIGDLIPAGKYTGFGLGCKIDITDRGMKKWIRIGPPLADEYEYQIVADLRSGDVVKTNCKLTPGSGEVGDVRTRSGVQISLRPGLYASAKLCTVALEEGANILRGTTSVTVFPTPTTSSFRLSSAIAVIHPSCGAITRIGD